MAFLNLSMMFSYLKFLYVSTLDQKTKPMIQTTNPCYQSFYDVDGKNGFFENYTFFNFFNAKKLKFGLGFF